jgi:hypothetical protein
VPTSLCRRKAVDPELYRPGLGTPPGSESGACTQGSSRNLGGLMCSRRETRCGRRDRSSPGPPQRCPGGGSEQGTTQGTAKRRQRSAAGWRMSNRSRLIVPSSAGNSPQRTRGREAADRSELPLAGQMSRTLGRASIFTQRQGLADWAGWAPGRERLLRTQGAHFFSVRSERLDRGAGCPNWARPDLWEPRVSNHPRPPGATSGFRFLIADDIEYFNATKARPYRWTYRGKAMVA